MSDQHSKSVRNTYRKQYKATSKATGRENARKHVTSRQAAYTKNHPETKGLKINKKKKTK